jgi:hypothetical protein
LDKAKDMPFCSDRKIYSNTKVMSGFVARPGDQRGMLQDRSFCRVYYKYEIKKRFCRQRYCAVLPQGRQDIFYQALAFLSEAVG